VPAGSGALAPERAPSVAAARSDPEGVRAGILMSPVAAQEAIRILEIIRRTHGPGTETFEVTSVSIDHDKCWAGAQLQRGEP
jgi:hypothetical protein